ncbi:MAG: hypothetical protein P1V97_19745 [Planctomycetota bacterium]|nr:hypothetical protein [Planctomycetota bacterium]
MVHSAARFIRESREVPRCAYCHSSFDNGQPRACRQCNTRLHEECWLEFGRCPNLGCEGVPLLPNKEEQRLMKVRQMARNLHNETLSLKDRNQQATRPATQFVQGPLMFIGMNLFIAIMVHFFFSVFAPGHFDQVFVEAWFFFFHLLFMCAYLFAWISRRS